MEVSVEILGIVNDVPKSIRFFLSSASHSLYIHEWCENFTVAVLILVFVLENIYRNQQLVTEQLW